MIVILTLLRLAAPISVTALAFISTLAGLITALSFVATLDRGLITALSFVATLDRCLIALTILVVTGLTVTASLVVALLIFALTLVKTGNTLTSQQVYMVLSLSAVITFLQGEGLLAALIHLYNLAGTLGSDGFQIGSHTLRR